MSTSMHFLTLDQFNKTQLEQLLQQAQQFADQKNISTSLAGKMIVNAFFENSTRTRISFEIAAKRLGAHVINFSSGTSSTQKGETLLDTVLTLDAMNIDAMVVRHSENGLVETLASQLKGSTTMINAGDGTHAHPSQGLLDLLTIRQHKNDFAALSVAICGDILHSRVVSSTVTGLHILGTKDIRFIAPTALLPKQTRNGVSIETDFEKGIQGVDVIIMLRMQKERMHMMDIPNIDDYVQSYQLSEKLLSLAKPDAIVMHPGPMNRGLEVTNEVADGAQSVILQQVKNGVFARMAILNQIK